MPENDPRKLSQGGVDQAPRPVECAIPRRAPNRLMHYFAAEHLPPHLYGVSRACGDLAETMDLLLDESPEKTVGLRKLLEAKDCFVRAMLDQHRQGENAGAYPRKDASLDQTLREPAVEDRR